MTVNRERLPIDGERAEADTLTIARWLVRRGLSVIPLDHPAETTQTDPKRIGKVPVTAWKPYQDAYATDDELQHWFGNGRRRNIGIVCGPVIVVDLDSAEAIRYADTHLPPTPMATRTARGEHRFFRDPRDARIRNKMRLRTGDPKIKIDIRARGGYVVAPPSVHASGAVYERIGPWPPVDQLPVFDPAWIAEELEQAPVLAPVPRVADGRSRLERARAYLGKVDPAIDGQGGDTHTYQVVCRVVRGFDLTDADACEVLSEWNATCQPPWTARELAAKVENARKYGEEPLGGRLETRRHHHDPDGGPGRREAQPNAPEPLAPVTLEDFYGYMPMHTFIYAPTREHWPGSSVNARVAPVVLIDEKGDPVLDEHGKPTQMKATAWIDRHRPVEQMTWYPGRRMLICDRLFADGGWIERPGVRVFNLYRPPTVELGDPDQAGPWLELAQTLFPGAADHIVAWLAHRVQRPDDKLNHALVLGGPQGIGKDTLLEPVKAAVGPWNFAEVSPTTLVARFNGFVQSVILRISEARDLGDVNRFGFYDHLKTYEASPPDVHRVDQKHLREYSVPNVCGVIITTNHRDGLYLPADDRRHYVAWSERTKEDFTSDYWTRFYLWCAGGGTGHVAAYLTSYDLSRFDPKAPPPKTSAFWAVVDANRAPEDADLADALDRLENPDVVTISQLAGPVPSEFSAWLKERKNTKAVRHRLEAAGYVAVPNTAARDRLWRIEGRRQVVYAKHTLTPRDRQAAAARLR